MPVLKAGKALHIKQRFERSPLNEIVVLNTDLLKVIGQSVAATDMTVAGRLNT